GHCRRIGSTLAAGGVFAVDKPRGPTSADIVEVVAQTVREKLGNPAFKVGHGGTLDPEATGVLVLGIGSGTRMMTSFLHGSKAYEATVTMGSETDTEDASGKVVATAPFEHVTKEKMEEIMPQFLGEILQVPPMFSALRVNGKRLYELAHQGVTVEREARKVLVHKLELLAFEPPTFSIRVECGGGLYVRTLGKDLARA
ncbi:unnamed protein product, partial [Polarella glacialis]